MDGLDRRHFIASGAVAVLATCGAGRLQAAEVAYPDRSIRVLIGTAPGDGADTRPRALFAVMSRMLGQALYLDNKPGAHGMIVAAAAKASEKNGYTLLVSTGGQVAINPALYGKRLTYDPMKDFEPIAFISGGPQFLYVNKDLPISNVRELAGFVRANPGKLSYGSGGIGTTQHLCMELLQRRLDVQMIHVPYRGVAQVIPEVMSGRLTCAFDVGGSIVPQANAGHVRMIGVTATRRLPSQPAIATLVEQGLADFDVTAWTGLFAPAGTPAAVMERLNSVVREAVKSPEYVALLDSTAGETRDMGIDEFRRFIRADAARWLQVVRQANITLAD